MIQHYSQWIARARPKQIAPSDKLGWNTWLILAGRGFGKTLAGGEDILSYALKTPHSENAVVAPTWNDIEKTCFGGVSGIISNLTMDMISNDRKTMYSEKSRVIKLYNGSKIHAFSAREYERLRGPQFHRAWCDEVAAWQYPEEAMDMLNFGLRLGKHPKKVITTTPKPTKLIKQLVKDAEEGNGVIITKGSTYDNADNLSPAFIAEIERKYENTRLGRQEIYAEVLDDVVGALWARDWIDETRIELADVPDLVRIVVAIDPAVTANEETSAETGIIVAGIDGNDKFYVLDDISCIDTPKGWATRAVKAYHDYEADKIVAETNNGGDMIENLLRGIDNSVSYRGVTATRGKVIRAEPIASLYEQRRVHHIGGLEKQEHLGGVARLEHLEEQMCSFTHNSDIKCDRMDALVWALTELSATGQAYFKVR